MASNGKAERLRLAVDSVRVAQYRRRYFLDNSGISSQFTWWGATRTFLAHGCPILVYISTDVSCKKYRRRYFLAEFLFKA